ncbi:MAG: hypothetical protein UY95_C0028G0007, partial [Parcubacteria group bacterium GW2011_GWA2_56_7]
MRRRLNDFTIVFIQNNLTRLLFKQKPPLTIRSVVDTIPLGGSAMSPAPSLAFGYRATSALVYTYAPFCDLGHPNVILGLQTMMTDPDFMNAIAARNGLTFEIGLEDARVRTRPSFGISKDACTAIEALARRLREDFLWLGGLLTRIPFRDIAKVLAPWIINTAFSNPRDLVMPEDFELDHGPSLIANSRSVRGLPRVSHATSARAPIDEIQERVVFDIPGLPAAVIELPRRGKPRVRIPGVPAVHALRDSTEANDLF